MKRWLTLAANQDVTQGSVAAGGLDCHAQEHANADVLRTATAKIIPVQSGNQEQYMVQFIKMV